MTKKRARSKPKDVAILHGLTEDGEGARVLRLREGEVSVGEVRPVREGQPIGQAELVRLKPMRDGSPVCEVEVLHEPAPKPARGGPARTASPQYRRNWNTIFGDAARKPRKKNKPEWSSN